MKNNFISLFLSLTVFLGSIEKSYSTELQKGLDAALIGDFETALKNWAPLAKGGNAFAQYNLGLMYDKGKGVQQSYKKAQRWYTLAAKQGNAFAQSNLGFMYDIGEGVPKDDNTAVQWYTLAAKQGNAVAQINLGMKYAKGQGVLKNNVRAYMWLNIAVIFGEEKAIEIIDKIAKLMSPAQIRTAKRLSLYCVKENYKGC